MSLPRPPESLASSSSPHQAQDADARPDLSDPHKQPDPARPPVAAATASAVGEEDPGATLDPPATGVGKERGGGEPYRRAVLGLKADHPSTPVNPRQPPSTPDKRLTGETDATK